MAVIVIMPLNISGYGITISTLCGHPSTSAVFPRGTLVRASCILHVLHRFPVWHDVMFSFGKCTNLHHLSATFSAPTDCCLISCVGHRPLNYVTLCPRMILAKHQRLPRTTLGKVRRTSKFHDFRMACDHGTELETAVLVLECVFAFQSYGIMIFF